MKTDFWVNIWYEEFQEEPKYLYIYIYSGVIGGYCCQMEIHCYLASILIKTGLYVIS